MAKERTEKRNGKKVLVDDDAKAFKSRIRTRQRMRKYLAASHIHAKSPSNHRINLRTKYTISTSNSSAM